MTDSAIEASLRPKGAFRLVEIGGIPVYVHRSFVLSGLFMVFMAVVASGGRLNPFLIPCMAIAYMIVIAIHEAGHALAARLLRLRAYSVRLRGFGGVCLVERPKRARDAILVYSAGFGAQLVLFLGTLLYARWSAVDNGTVATAVIFTFTFANALLAFVNLVPFTTRQGMQSDGKILLRLCRDKLLGRTYVAPSFAGMKPKETAPIFSPETSLLSIKSLVPPGFMQGLEILSDPVTPLTFVIEMFVKHFHWDNATALSRAIEIHNQGGLLLDRTMLGNSAAAQALAEESLSVITQFEGNWNCGNAVHVAHTVLGLIALQLSDEDRAISELRQSAAIGGSPQLNSFGPKMSLARALLERGRSEEVLDYFEQCRSFWALGGKWLDVWASIVKAGRLPNFFQHRF